MSDSAEVVLPHNVPTPRAAKSKGKGRATPLVELGAGDHAK